MTSSPDYYREVLEEAGFDDEGLTILLVQGATRAEVATALGVDLDSEPVMDDTEWDDPDLSAYAIGDVSGGVVAIEHTGYADPTLTALREVTNGGRSAAVVRGNIQAHYRFGCARDGQVLFDDDEYTFIEDKERVPEELRALHDGVWTDVSGDSDAEGDQDLSGTGLAMAEVITGLRLTSDDLRRAADSGYRAAPALLYSRE